MRVLKPRLLVIGAVAAAVALGGCSSTSDNPTIQGSPSATAPATVTSSATLPLEPSITVTNPTTTATPPAAGSPSPTTAPATLTTLAAAEAYVQTKAQDLAGAPFSFVGPDATWRPSATLHVLHATPTAAASSGGDYYFFFVAGRSVGQSTFTGYVSDATPDVVSFAVTYHVYKPGDAHCCPAGGTATTTFRWDGSQLTHTAMTGATQS